MTTPLNACTIVSKNYICYARVLCDSFLESHPDGRFFVLLVDRNDGYIDAEKERFTLFEAEDLPNIPRRDAFLFKYTLLECNTAIKPFFLEHLIQGYDLPNLVYFDPDIHISGSLDRLAKLVERYSVVLTPHLTDPIDDEAYPNEQAILQSGSYNLGFVAFRATETSLRVIRWWQDRLYDKCLVRIPDGLFVDQKWMDLVPGMFGGESGEVHILTDPGYNVAYWNLHGREVTLTPEGPRSNDSELVFFHFSGIRPESLDGVSKHQDRFRLQDIGDAAELYREYAAKVIEAGYFECRPWPYAFGVFHNGLRIPDAARSLFHQLSADEQAAFDDPFTTDGKKPFLHWLTEPARGQGPSRLLKYLYDSRADLQFGDVTQPDGWAAYSAWLLELGRHELGLDPQFLADVDRNPGDWLSAGGVKRRLKHLAKRLYHSGPGRSVKEVVKRRLGPEGSRRLKDKLRKPPPPAAGPSVATGRPPLDIQGLGVNLVGYLDAETGMGQAGRSLLQALQTADVPVSPHTLELGVVARRGASELAGAQSDFEHGINLFVVNADQAAAVHESLGAGVYHGRFNIGLWLWELDRFPVELQAAFDFYDEIWTPSTFCADAIGAVSPIPVRRVPLPVEPAAGDEPTPEIRDRFGIPESAFAFFFMFNFLSYAERKNPEGLVRAFKKAFPSGQDTALVLKTSQRDFAPESYDRLAAEIDGDPRVVLIDDYLSAEDIDALTRSIDAYVSLHRSEGFGLTLAEAMFHGKPVIATPYSGVTDFFDLNNGYPVRYELVTLDQAVGPYAAGSRWADPDPDHAAELMRQVVDDESDRLKRTERAQRDVAERLSYRAVGGIARERLAEIVRRSGSVKELSMPLR